MKIKVFDKITTELVEMDSSVEFETYYTADNGQSTIIPMSSKWKKIGILVSGGLDSALLLYLTAKTIIDNNLEVKIQPISLEIPTKAKNLESSRAIISEIRKILDADKIILDSKEVIMPHEYGTLEGYIAGKKFQFFNDTMTDMYNSEELSFDYNGNTKNPPEHVRNHFHNNNVKHGREYNRDNPQTIYNGPWSASPHYMIDKSGIINLYIKHGILESVATKTLSCDQNIDTAIHEKLDIPCGKCWWCDERKWGFESNNAIDNSPKQPRLW